MNRAENNMIKRKKEKLLVIHTLSTVEASKYDFTSESVHDRTTLSVITSESWILELAMLTISNSAFVTMF